MAVKYNLTKEFIEEVKSTSDIVRYIGRHVKLRKRGKNYLGLCPFHDEKTPSFNVSSDQQMYYCFGCGAGGDVFKFMMQHENMSFVEAVVELAKEAHLKIPEATREDQAREDQSAAIVEVNEAALSWFREQLLSERGSDALEYLHNRGIDEQAVEEFEIGFAPDVWDGLLNALSDRFDKSLMEQAALIQQSSRSGELIDRFRKRIMLPIRSASGRLVAFGGRIFGEGEPKFLNSPETPVFRKRRNLFGLHRGARTARKRNFAILVEGYFDAVVLHRHGFENTVAPLGTSLTEEQAKLLRRYTDKTIICMDADEAGQRAAVRAAGLLLEQGFTVNIVPLPAGEDPDSYVRKRGKDEFRELLTGSQPAYGYVLNETLSRFDLSRPYGKREALVELLPLLARVRDPIERSHAISETAENVGVEDHVVATELSNYERGRTAERKSVPTSTKGALSWLSTAERKLILISMRDPTGSKQVVDEFEIAKELSSFTRKILERIFSSFEDGQDMTFNALSDIAENEDEKRALAALAVEFNREFPESAHECILSIALAALQRQVSELNERISQLEEGDVEAFGMLHEEKRRLTVQISKLGLRGQSPRGINNLVN